jgi:hypothetical protein
MDGERQVRDANARPIGPTSDATAIDRDIRGRSGLATAIAARLPARALVAG